MNRTANRARLATMMSHPLNTIIRRFRERARPGCPIMSGPGNGPNQSICEERHQHRGPGDVAGDGPGEAEDPGADDGAAADHGQLRQSEHARHPPVGLLLRFRYRAAEDPVRPRPEQRPSGRSSLISHRVPHRW
ncbi:hypothetical protein [Saccharopolyspora pogona]|uniref:hypothetical protein n=1 Tax=Saccharopolyspora pogona TaxID=333966 RepID=UPI0016826FB0|nr:hypothetical protein [Saccharopolyspora pogona]